MINIQKKYLVIAIAGAVGLGALAAHAEEFSASATVQSTLEVTVVQNFDLGTLYATETGAALANGVAALTIAPDGVVTEPADSTTVSLTNLGTPIPAQGSVAMTADFVLTLPDTTLIDPTDFPIDAGTSLVNITNGTGNAAELVHESANPAVPSLWMMAFDVEEVSGGTVGTETAGDWPITQNFGETTFVFNIGATITTEPNASGTAIEYQEGIYAGTFEVTASY